MSDDTLEARARAYVAALPGGDRLGEAFRVLVGEGLVAHLVAFGKRLTPLGYEQLSRDGVPTFVSRALGLVEVALASEIGSEAVRHQTGGTAPELVQGILDGIFALRREVDSAREAGRAEAAEEIRRSIAARREARVQACAPDREYSEREVIGLEIDALEEVLSLLSAAPAAREERCGCGATATHGEGGSYYCSSCGAERGPRFVGGPPAAREDEQA